MLDFSIFPLFCTATFFLVISPGPDLVLISTYSSTKGFIAGLLVTLGVFFAGILQTLLVALGLRQLMQSMPMLAYAIKIIGALYFIYSSSKVLSSFVLLVNIAFSVTFSQFGKLVGNKLKLGRHIDGLLGVIFLGLATRLATSK